jgi:carotenoid cleavage dioxygenase-like enzyme
VGTASSGLTRATIDPERGRSRRSASTEFPRIDARLTGLSHRYLTVAGRSGDDRATDGEHDRVFRYDSQAGTSVLDDAGDFPSAPIAKVTIPHRVPNGLHGNWFPPT